MPDFNNKPDVTAAANLDNIGAWVTLASNPVAFNERLEQFKSAQEAAVQAEAVANEKIALVGKAEEITALLEQANANVTSSQEAVADAAKQAQAIVEDAIVRASSIVAVAEASKRSIEEALLVASQAAAQRDALLDTRQQGIDDQYALSQRKADSADAAREQYEARAKEATDQKEIAVERLNLINEQFEKFFAAIK